jgi:hypothetical protein
MLPQNAIFPSIFKLKFDLGRAYYKEVYFKNQKKSMDKRHPIYIKAWPT